MALDRPEDAAPAFEAAWNAHDMERFGSLFDEDAAFVNRFGRYVRGVDAIVEMHAKVHATVYRDSSLANEVIDRVAVGADAAILYFWSRLSAGAAHPAGPHSVDTLIQAVLVRKNGAWRIKGFENVTLTDPRSGSAILRPTGPKG